MFGTLGGKSRSLGTGLFLGTNDRYLCAVLWILFMEKTGRRRYKTDGGLYRNPGNMEMYAGGVLRDDAGIVCGMRKGMDTEKQNDTKEKSGAEVGTISICRLLSFVVFGNDLTRNCEGSVRFGGADEKDHGSV